MSDEPAQLSPAWFEARKGRVTGSMVGAILGLSPYMTRADAMRSMVRAVIGEPAEFTGNVATEYGNAHESGALIEFQMETELRVRRAPFLIYEDWLGASPDGFVSDGGLVEVKCPYGLRNDTKPIFKSPAEQPHYYAQMQVQMLVAGGHAGPVSHCHFWQWSRHGTMLHRVPFDQSWIDENLPRLRQFHAEFLDEVANNADEHRAPKRVEIDTPEARKMIAEWDDLNERLDQLNERKKDLLTELVKIAGGKNALLSGTRKLTLTERQGAVAYARVVKDHCKGVDLEPYRGKSSSFWQVR